MSLYQGDKALAQNLKHADKHASGGTDPITPSSIGTYSSSELDAFLANKAPAGCGLGGAVYVDDFNTVVETGFYYGYNNAPGNFWHNLLVIGRKDDVIQQIAISQITGTSLGLNRGTISLRAGKLANGSWTFTEWEYINPPFSTDIVYRTTERYNDLPIYKKQDSSGVIWWSTDQTTWKREAERMGAAASSHNHSTDNLTSGTLSVAHGGTGKSSVTSGNFLVGNGTGALTEKTPAQVLSAIGAAASSHNHAAGNITSGTLAVARGGTGAADAATARSNLGVAYGTVAGTVCQGNDNRLSNARTPTAHNHAAGNITSGTLAVARGGTGITASPSMLTNLASTTAASVFAASPRPGVTGILPVANGGTGTNSLKTLASNMGLTEIVSGSYTGTGTQGASNPCRLTFDFMPRLVIINQDDSARILTMMSASNIGVSDFGTGSTKVVTTWTSNSVSWYYKSDSSTGGTHQLNFKGKTYCYICFGSRLPNYN